eukprot:502612_1
MSASICIDNNLQADKVIDQLNQNEIHYYNSEYIKYGLWEIMNDTSTKATLDSKDSFIYKANMYTDSSIPVYSNSSHYDSNILYNSITETNNTENYNDNDSSFIYSVPPPHIP